MATKKRRGPMNNSHVREIRYEYRHGGTVKKIAARYAVSQSTVRRIINYETYRGDG
jgi:DNA invertase Pin-like site-specific DNA recombinase